jgi:hypothetical protein
MLVPRAGITADLVQADAYAASPKDEGRGARGEGGQRGAGGVLGVPSRRPRPPPARRSLPAGACRAHIAAAVAMWLIRFVHCRLHPAPLSRKAARTSCTGPGPLRAVLSSVRFSAASVSQVSAGFPGLCRRRPLQLLRDAFSRRHALLRRSGEASVLATSLVFLPRCAWHLLAPADDDVDVSLRRLTTKAKRRHA